MGFMERFARFWLHRHTQLVVRVAEANAGRVLAIAGLAFVAFCVEGMIGLRSGSGSDRRDAEPQPDCSQVFDWLFIGGERAATRLELSQNRITHVLNCCEHLPFYSNRTKNQRLRLKDSRNESLSTEIYVAFKFLDKVQEENGRCLVHCRKGASRSVAIVLAYLVLRLRYRLRDAWRLVHSKRPVARPNRGYCRQLCDFEEDSLGEASMTPKDFHASCDD